MSSKTGPDSAHSADVTIIGAGPVGLFAVFECGMLGLTCQVVDSLSGIGGQCSALYPEKPIYDIPAWPQINAGELIDKLAEQAAPFKPSYILGQKIVSIGGKAGEWQLLSDKGEAFHSRAIIIAAGAGAFGPNRPPLEGIEDYEDHSVFYMIRNKDMFQDQQIVIAGGGDSAVDWALALADIAAKVTLMHRRAKFRAAPESVSRMEKLAAEGKIDLCVPAQLAGLEGQDGILSGVQVQFEDGSEKIIPARYLLPFYGLAASLGPIAEWNLEIDGQTVKTTSSTSQTNIAGIYAIGDIAAYEHKLKLILTGFAEAAQAAHAIYRQINPDKALHMEYSTTKGLPGGLPGRG